ncbi:hypothetical protein [Planktotalea sp.]|uniref:hypothetical protein n=1 Tax=Planktotalea sp. TaxID=2029877 RepID=UPI003296D960
MTDRSQSRRTFATLFICVLTLLICLALLFTRFGAFIVFDVLADIGAPDRQEMTYLDAPVIVPQTLKNPSEIPVPKHIEQISGLFRKDDKLFLSTDQSEVFVIDETGQTRGGNVFPFTPLLIRQGRLEAITWTGLAFGLVGEFGSMLRVSERFERLENLHLPSQIAELEYSGLSSGPDKFFFTTDGTAKITALVRSTGEVRSFDLDFDAFAKPGQNPQMLRWSGIAYNNGLIYMSAQDYPIVVVADANSGRLVTVLGMEGTIPFSDVAVSDAQLYVPRDHNYFDPRPPILVFELKAVSRNIDGLDVSGSL